MTDSGKILAVTDIPVAHHRVPYLQRVTECIARLNRKGAGATFKSDAAFAGKNSLDAVRSGHAQMAWINSSHLETLHPIFARLNHPFQIDDNWIENAGKLPALVRQLDEASKSSDLAVLGVMRGADQLFASARRELVETAAIKNRPVRVAGPGIYETIVRTLGGHPLPIPIPELLQGFDENLFDTIFTSPGGWKTVLGMRMPYALRVPGLMVITYLLVVKRNWFRNLDAGLTSDICRIAEAEVTLRWGDMYRDDLGILQAMSSQGAELRTVDDLPEWKGLMEPIRQQALAWNKDSCTAFDRLCFHVEKN